MQQRNSKMEFLSLAAFVGVGLLILTNGFAGRIAAQGSDVDVYQQIEPIGVVLDTVLQEYVHEADIGQLVEGALHGIMGSLDKHSSFITASDLADMREQTSGEFEGIGVSIRLDDNGLITVFTPIPDSPAAKAGVQPFDIITAIDDIPTDGMGLGDAAEKIRGPRGTTVKLNIARPTDDPASPLEPLEFVVKRDKVPLESIKEARLLDGQVGYIRISDFKDNTARDIKRELDRFLDEGMRAFILDLRWNPGGLLSASKDVCEIFLERNSLVTYTKGRQREGRPNREDMKLHTQGTPALPRDFPIIVLVNEHTASSAEIVTGALQFYQRAIIVGEKTFGKGSVQTIIPLSNPESTALRLTTALYYTPADVTIDGQGIIPDVEVPMDADKQRRLGQQMYRSYENDPAMINEQNHGSVTGNVMDEDTVEDMQLLRAVEILREDAVWENLLLKYHRDVRETQLTASAAANLLEQARGADPGGPSLRLERDTDALRGAPVAE